MAGRFEDPVVEPFAGAVEDSGPLTACPQNSFRLSFLMGGHDELTQTEDCHFLSIYTPSRKGARPVLVWIHGGAYLAGSGEEAAYDGSMLVEEGDIVVVTISYRLGAFGYLHDMDNRIVNLGLKDQIAALRWVRDNISCFGGDPDKITLAGQSAGGHSVASILSSSNEPLCRRAIIQSAPFTFSNTVKSARKMLAAFTKIAGGAALDLVQLAVQGQEHIHVPAFYKKYNKANSIIMDRRDMTSRALAKRRARQ